MRFTPLTPSAFRSRKQIERRRAQRGRCGRRIGIDAQPLAVGVQDRRHAQPLDVHGEARAGQAREQVARGSRLAYPAIELGLDERQRR